MLAGHQIPAAGYADDIILCATSLTDAEMMLSELKRALARAGLELSQKIDKNLIMKANCKRKNERDEDAENVTFGEDQFITIAAQKMKVVSEMMVVGCMVSANGPMGMSLRTR